MVDNQNAVMRRSHSGIARCPSPKQELPLDFDHLRRVPMLETAEAIRGHHPTSTAIGVVVVIGALLRFHNLGSESLWFDEVASWMQSERQPR